MSYMCRLSVHADRYHSVLQTQKYKQEDSQRLPWAHDSGYTVTADGLLWLVVFEWCDEMQCTDA